MDKIKIEIVEDDQQKPKKKEDLWLRNIAKSRRNAGEEYIAKCGVIVQRKRDLSASIEKCCKKKCYERVPFNVQKTTRTSFWDIGEYEKQNIALAGLMVPKEPKISVRNATSHKSCIWEYYIKDKDKEMIVCKPLFCDIFNIGKGRVEQIQMKIKENKSLGDRRGKHSNHPTKLIEHIKEEV